MPEITDEHKRNLLGRNYADLVGLDVGAARNRLADDDFSRQTEDEGLADPFSTTNAAAEVY
jgi:hypothetical protein